MPCYILKPLPQPLRKTSGKLVSRKDEAARHYHHDDNTNIALPVVEEAEKETDAVVDQSTHRLWQKCSTSDVTVVSSSDEENCYPANEQQLFEEVNHSSILRACRRSESRNATDDEGTKSTSCGRTGDNRNRSSYYDEEEDDNRETDQTTSFSTMSGSKSISPRRSYPILDPSPDHKRGCHQYPSIVSDERSHLSSSADHHFDHEHDPFELNSLQVEMAKTAFLKNPWCQELWMDLVHCVHMQNNNMRPHERLQINHEEKEINVIIDDNNGVSPETLDEYAEDEDTISWASFEKQQQAVWNQFGENDNDDVGWPASDCGNPNEATFSDLDNNGSVNHENSNGNVVLDRALARLENSIASLEEKVLRHFEETSSSSSYSEYNPDSLLSVEDEKMQPNNDEHDIKKKSIMPLLPHTPTIPTSRLHSEIQYWEKRIMQYDQRYVNVVAAALDEAQHTVSWKVGQIVEVVPSSQGGTASDDDDDDLGEEGDHEILYVV